MKNILIIEDEILAFKRLSKMINTIYPDANIVDVIDTVEESVEYLSKKETNAVDHQSELDLILMDIQLADGLSFDIFDQIEIKVPVIFTTAFDEYAINAFKVNAIDYLLKPIKEEELATALRKVEKKELEQGSKKAVNGNSLNIEQIHEVIGQIRSESKQFSDRFLVRTAEKYLSLKIHQIKMVFTENTVVYLITNEGKKFVLEDTIENIAVKLDPKYFFRTNRQSIVHIDSEFTAHKFFNGKIKLTFNGSDREFVISRDRAKPFKNWLAGDY